MLRALIWLMLLCSVSTFLNAREVMHSSVSPEFMDGLHAKYLRYLADKMDMDLDLVPMPFARRVLALRKGQIDIMVGLQRENAEDDDVVYLYPSYETLRHSFFVKAENLSLLNNFEQLTHLKIGVTLHAKYFQHFQQQPDMALIAVSTLKQKIELLKIDRIDTFIHYQESAEYMLKKMDLGEKIVLAPYQPTEFNEYYVTLSEKSQLLPYRDKLQKIIQQGVNNGDFIKIREAHYELQEQ